MSVEKISSYKYMCDVERCENYWIGNVRNPSGWGIVRIYDKKLNFNEIGDQDGWNNYNLCPEHYVYLMTFFGIKEINIPEIPMEEEEGQK